MTSMVWRWQQDQFVLSVQSIDSRAVASPVAEGHTVKSGRPYEDAPSRLVSAVQP
jgi:hypothetical protein